MPAGEHTQVHAHRGLHGATPGNTVPAFLAATSAGCPWIELDVVITGDAQVLVSHEPWIDHRSCLDYDGRALDPATGRTLNIFAMTLQEVQRYRCLAVNGKEPADGPVCKPLLAEAVHAVDAEARRLGMAAPSFNIEVKSNPAHYGSFQPRSVRFAELVLQQVKELGLEDRCLIQSFDPAVLEAADRMKPHVPLALLVENADGLEQNLARLDFTPRFYSPDVELVTEGLVLALRRKGIGLLVWTVNEEAAMRRMIAFGVDGLITDDPVKAMRLVAGDH